MTNSPTSDSEPSQRSNSFDLLHPTMQRWVHDQGWTSLHDAQEQAIGPIVRGDRDVIIAAATAAGKTEAAFLPICSVLTEAAALNEPQQIDPWSTHDPWAEPNPPAATGAQVLYLSPLKALINDQYDRLEQLCERADIAVHRWHGDVAGSAKHRMLKQPSGVLLITPESLEAMFVLRGSKVAALFAGVRFIVIDELHSFLSEPRGAQLQSLMNRVELAVRRRVPRIGLSATLGDMNAAARFIRPTDPSRVVAISSSADSRALQMQVRGYVQTAPALSKADVAAAVAAGREVALEDTLDGDKVEIVDHLFRNLRGKDNLAFANARTAVEVYADLLSRRCEAERLPNEFWPHHGNLSKDLRETVEAQLKDRTRPATAVCTSTLEMGVDIGSVACVAQIGVPPSVASLRQRLGRSGRRDDPAVLRMYVSEPEVDERTGPIGELRCGMVQTVAMVQLMLERWIESPDDPGYNYSTLIQQTMSTIAQHGGATAADLHGALCGPGPFELVDSERYVRLLRAMAGAELIIQATDGLLLHGPVGDRFVNHHSFFTAFQTADEWRLVAGGRTLGTVPITQPLYEGVLLIFSGRRWKVTGVDPTAKVVELARASGGNPPDFDGSGGPAVSDRVRARMVDVYRSSDVPAWLDAVGARLLQEGRDAWRRLQLNNSPIICQGADLLLFPWTGDRVLHTATIVLRGKGFDADTERVAIRLANTSPEQLAVALDELLDRPRPDPAELAALVKNKHIDKWDWVLDDTLACESVGARLLDVEGAYQILELLSTALRDSDTTMLEPATDDPPATLGGSLRLRLEPAGTVPNLRSHEFCVIDVETTGFSPRLGDRIVEIAAVRVRGDGTTISEWSTLVDPQRDIGASHVHGISAGDVVGAPRFEHIVGDLLAQIDGAVLVAHNFRFDRDFLAAEFTRAGVQLPELPAVCTLSLGNLVQPGTASRKLAACCARLGIELTDAHDALADARATACVLSAYLDIAHDAGRRTLEEIGCTPLEWPVDPPDLAPSARQHRRGGTTRRIEQQGQYLARLVSHLDDDAQTDADTSAYLDLLDRALEDRRLTEVEAAALAATAQEWQLAPYTVRDAHHHYFTSLLRAAAADGVISELERSDLMLVSALLELDPVETRTAIDSSTKTPDVTSSPQWNLAGKSVCFTGTLVGRVGGVPLTRTDAHRLAEQAGLEVKKNVSRGLDLLVVADPDSQSGKAKLARQIGTRVIAEAAFWAGIGVSVD